MAPALLRRLARIKHNNSTSRKDMLLLWRSSTTRSPLMLGCRQSVKSLPVSSTTQGTTFASNARHRPTVKPTPSQIARIKPKAIAFTKSYPESVPSHKLATRPQPTRPVASSSSIWLLIITIEDLCRNNWSTLVPCPSLTTSVRLKSMK